MQFLIIVFILLMCFFVYITWAKHDDFCFALIFILLLSVLYVLKQKDAFEIREAFNITEKESFGEEIMGILKPKLDFLASAFRGDAKVNEQKYDDQGNEIESDDNNEVDASSMSVEDLALNRILTDMEKFDPGTYKRLAELALR